MATSYHIRCCNHIITDGDAIFHLRNQLQGFEIAGTYKMLTPEQEQLFTLAQKLYQLGYRREWMLGDELWYERKQQPGFYHIEYVFHAHNAGYIFIRRHARTLRISLRDENLIHIPRTDDVLDWFKQQRWIDFYTLRNEEDASYEFTFYYHQRAAYQTLHHTDSRFIALQAMLAAYELMVQIIAD